jgi:hypothetical protein
MQRPSTLSVLLCDQMLFERDTNKAILVGVFNRIHFSDFPSPFRPFDVHAAVTDGQGRVTLDLVITQLTTEEQIAALSLELNFSDPLFILNVRFRFRMVSFPAPGIYLVELLADGTAVGHTRLEVLELETPS